MNSTIVVAIILLMILLIFPQNKRVDNFINDYPPSIMRPRFGLRGERLRVSDIRHKYIWPKSNFRIMASGGQMYESRRRPHPMEGTCNKVSCPEIFDRRDGTCWYCK